MTRTLDPRIVVGAAVCIAAAAFLTQHQLPAPNNELLIESARFALRVINVFAAGLLGASCGSYVGRRFFRPDAEKVPDPAGAGI